MTKKQAAHSWRRISRGNSLMEYVVPTCAILFGAGLLMTLSNQTALVAKYFMAASGRSDSSLTGSTFKTNGFADNTVGLSGNGLEGFPGTYFAQVSNGSGSSAEASQGGTFYASDGLRAGGRPAPASSDYLYP